MIRFLQPWWLLAVVPVLLVAGAYVWRQLRRRDYAIRFTNVDVLAGVMRGRLWRQYVPLALFLLAVAALCLGFARPQRETLVPKDRATVILVVDVSRSMEARDVLPDRLERAKAEIGAVLPRLSDHRVGVVAFAGETLTYPPTTDYAAIKLFWQDLHPWDMPVGGTAIGRAIRAGLDQLVALRGKEGATDATRGQAILLLTDGEDTDSEPLEAADQASKLGVKIFTVGVGSRSGELIPVYDQQGKIEGYVKDADGKYVTSRLGEQTLAEIARRTGGEVFFADSKRFGVEDVVAGLASLKRTENDGRPVMQYDEAFQWLMFAVLLALCAEVAISERRRPRRQPPAEITS